jgi:hypothetical protein
VYYWQEHKGFPPSETVLDEQAKRKIKVWKRAVIDDWMEENFDLVQQQREKHKKKTTEQEEKEDEDIKKLLFDDAFKEIGLGIDEK